MGQRLLKALASLQLAVIVILSIAVITAWGTLVEAKFNDSAAAQKLVYHSIWMYATMGLLCVNLTAVMIDRWPWKVKHTGFVLAHIGIMVLLGGSLVTQYFGVDGSISIGIGEKSRHVMVAETVLSLYTSLDGGEVRPLFGREVDFFLNRPKDHPLDVPIPDGSLKITDYIPYALRDEKIVESTNKEDGAGVRFQLQNSNVSLTEWLLLPRNGGNAVKNLGPAQVVFAPGKFEAPGDKNTIVLRKKSDDGTLEYEVHTARKLADVKRGVLKPGDVLETGWMGLVLRVLKFAPHASEQVKFIAVASSTPLTQPAIKVVYNGVENWMSLNSMLRLFSNQAVYILTFSNRRIDLGMDLALKDFQVGRYQGTMRAASYQSVVDVPGRGETVISMNEPLKHGGYTFYQASFQEDDSGKPVASILSVNYDPGRWIKYLGSLLIVLGTVHMFWFKNKVRKAGRAQSAAGSQENKSASA